MTKLPGAPCFRRFGVNVASAGQSGCDWRGRHQLCGQHWRLYWALPAWSPTGQVSEPLTPQAEFTLQPAKPDGCLLAAIMQGCLQG